MADSKSSSNGIGAISLLGIVFIVLKLIGIIDWSWGWVLLPFYGGILLVIVILIIIGVILYLND